ncbi:hypothetical protein XELAEV_18046766mg [Xenopus laevis]|uniref:Uncharacterized protein n=1 Tax=Xenopus laevis TaxID=8355 RepID=A0A974BTK2_XENLA|nr:hypothetical protein XELAEV_18046766mg [Xenopus laevis]
MASFSILWLVIALRITQAHEGLVHCNCKSGSAQRGDDVTMTCNNIQDLKCIKVMECKESFKECNESLAHIEVNISNTSVESALGLLKFHHTNGTSEFRPDRRQNGGCYCMTVVAANGRITPSDCYVKLNGEGPEQKSTEQTQDFGNQTMDSSHMAKSQEMYQDSPKIWYMLLIIVALAGAITFYIYMRRRTRQMQIV